MWQRETLKRAQHRLQSRRSPVQQQEKYKKRDIPWLLSEMELLDRCLTVTNKIYMKIRFGVVAGGGK